MMTRGAGDEREILEVSHVTEQDFETTEGTSEDLYSNSCNFPCLIKYVQRDPRVFDKGRFFLSSWRPHKLCVSCSQHRSE